MVIAPAGPVFHLDVDPAAGINEMILVVKEDRQRLLSRLSFRHAAVPIEKIPVVSIDAVELAVELDTYLSRQLDMLSELSSLGRLNAVWLVLLEAFGLMIVQPGCFHAELDEVPKLLLGTSYW